MDHNLDEVVGVWKPKPQITNEEAMEIKKELFKLIEDGASIEQVESFIYQYYHDHSKGVMYFLWNSMVLNNVGNFTYAELLKIWFDLYIMDICSEEVSFDLECLVDEYKKETIQDDEEITIYRGVNEYSLEFDDCISWTRSKDIAYWFACRFGDKDSQVVTATVKKGDIIVESNDRGEQEVVVLPRDVYRPSFENVAYREDEIGRIKSEMENREE